MNHLTWRHVVCLIMFSVGIVLWNDILIYGSAIILLLLELSRANNDP